MWNQFVFQTAGKIRFGPAELNAIGEEVVRLGRKILLVAGRHTIDENVTGRIGDLCGEAGADVVLMDSPPQGEPDLECIDRGRVEQVEFRR